MRKWILLPILVLLLISGCNTSPKPINTTSVGIAIKGYDSVAYFTDQKPVKGVINFAHKINDATWIFSNKEHLALFIANPEKYMPQYGGY